MKTALYQDVPSPGPFFQPLYSVHNGDFQVCDPVGQVGVGPGCPDVRPPQDVGLGEVWEPLSVLRAFLVYTVACRVYIERYTHCDSNGQEGKLALSCCGALLPLVSLISLLMEKREDSCDIASSVCSSPLRCQRQGLCLLLPRGGPWSLGYSVAAVEGLAPPGPLAGVMSWPATPVIVPSWALTGHPEDSLAAPWSPLLARRSCSTGRRSGRRAPWVASGLCLGPLALSEDGASGGLLAGSAQVLPAGSARLGSSWPFSLLTEGMVSKIVIERDDLELKAEALVRAVG